MYQGGVGQRQEADQRHAAQEAAAAAATAAPAAPGEGAPPGGAAPAPRLPAFYQEDTPASANEMWQRLHADPLFAIKQQVRRAYGGCVLRRGVGAGWVAVKQRGACAEGGQCFACCRMLQWHYLLCGAGPLFGCHLATHFPRAPPNRLPQELAARRNIVANPVKMLEIKAQVGAGMEPAAAVCLVHEWRLL